MVMVGRLIHSARIKQRRHFRRESVLHKAARWLVVLPKMVISLILLHQLDANTMNPSAPLVDQLWQGLLETAMPEVRRVLSGIIRRDKTTLALAFYGSMMEDIDAAQFLSVKSVEERLKPGLERWLERLFCHDSSEELKAVLAMQRHIGEVHARAEIPVHLVARGMRFLKREINRRLLETDLSRMDLANAVLHVDHLIDIAFEEMSAAFVHSYESNVRVDEGYRMFAAGLNLSLEREKQIGALLDWENRLFRALATEAPFNDLSSISNSAFGLWLHHKAALIFDDTHELPEIDDALRRIDQSLFPQLALGSGSGNSSLQPTEIRRLIKAVTAEVEQIRFLLGAMFERLTDLEIGRDPLTQVFNRRFMPTILKREIELNRRKGENFCLLMLDIDYFKRVNDQFGHDSGDRVLQTISGLLLNQVRASDFVFRYGGEEFLVVLAEVDDKQAANVAEKIRSRVEASKILLSDNRTISVTLSIGVAGFDGHPDYQRMVDRADKALYAAKQAGRNTVVVASD